MLVPARSSIHGLGLFAESPILPRKKIGEYTGERISIREARKRARKRRRIAIIEVDHQIAIDGAVNGGPFRFINHSCKPNLFIRIAHGRVEFYTKRKIDTGEELTCDYGETHHDGALRCRCGASNCREFI